MKNKLKELDVDFIGGQQPITPEEEQAISSFIKANKEKSDYKLPVKSKQKKRHHTKNISLPDRA